MFGCVIALCNHRPSSEDFTAHTYWGGVVSLFLFWLGSQRLWRVQSSIARLRKGKSSSAVGTFGSQAKRLQFALFILDSRAEVRLKYQFQSEPWGRLSTDDWHYVANWHCVVLLGVKI